MVILYLYMDILFDVYGCVTVVAVCVENSLLVIGGGTRKRKTAVPYYI